MIYEECIKDIDVLNLNSIAVLPLLHLDLVSTIDARAIHLLLINVSKHRVPRASMFCVPKDLA